MGQAYLLTGRPGVGKTTCLRRAVERLGRPAGGFFTEEVRRRGTRAGFALVTLDGERAMLAETGRREGPRVGKYAVDLEALDRIGVPAIRRAIAAGAVVVVDEIGRMELASEAFRAAVAEALASEAPILGTILAGPHPWADRIKRDPRVTVLEVTLATRDALPAELARRLAARPEPAP